jgi:hypothetical protein
MSALLDLTGQRFGRWEAVACAGITPRGGAIWRCVCDCGELKDVSLSSLRAGDSRSCGCIKRDAERGNRFKDRTGHRFGKLTAISEEGRSKGGDVMWRCACDCGNECVVVPTRELSSCGCNRHRMTKTPVYRAWANMKDRCDNPRSARYHRYGGRGITVCDAWQKFEGFYADMGLRPRGGTIDRTDNNGNYEPGNCRWITNFAQQSNRSNNRWIEIDGKRKTLAQWGMVSPMSKTTIRRRLAQGWTPKDAVFKDVRPQHALGKGEADG